MDFRVSAADPVLESHRDKLLLALKGMGEQRGLLFKSGASFHYYGLRLMDETEWRQFLGRCLLTAPLTDARYVAHRLIEGFGVLRIASTRRKPVSPFLVGAL
jgi:hypothetical protein